MQTAIGNQNIKMNEVSFEIRRKMCRTCLEQTEDLESLDEMTIVEATRHLSYAELLKVVTNINVSRIYFKESCSHIYHYSINSWL